MWIFVAAVVVVAVVAIVVAALMRPGSDDVSVRSYHSALGTLEHLSHPERRVQRPSARRGPGDPGPLDDPLRSPPPVPPSGSEHSLELDDAVLFDDTGPRERPVPPSAGVMPPRARRAQKIALDSMNRRRRRGGGLVLVVVAVVAFAALAYVGSRRSNGSSHASATRTTTHARSVTSTTVHHTQTVRPPVRSTTTTTLPSRIVASTTSSTGTAATYPVGSAPFTLEIAASGPCWVDASTVATGATLWTGTLQAGAKQLVSASGATTVELGAATVALAVDAKPVVLPTSMHAPFTATFEPAGAPAASPATPAPQAG